jgi:hypothetical protein
MAATGNTDSRDMAMSPNITTSPDMAEKGQSKELETAGNESSDGIDGGTNYHSWDNHTSFNKYPTHEPGYENKVCSNRLSMDCSWLTVVV